MAIYDFDMIFSYFVVGWEETTHASRVLIESIYSPHHNFQIPPPSKSFYIHFIEYNLYLFIILINLTLIFLDKYYLVDATYTHTCGFMALYCNVWY